jgi:hypothetical protein
MWEAKLAREFPGRKFVVHFEEAAEKPRDFVVTFYQDRGESLSKSVSSVL